jgi:hypothetical protein
MRLMGLSCSRSVGLRSRSYLEFASLGSVLDTFERLVFLAVNVQSIDFD